MDFLASASPHGDSRYFVLVVATCHTLRPPPPPATGRAYPVSYVWESVRSCFHLFRPSRFAVCLSFRVFVDQVSNATGKLAVTLVCNFDQSDLCADDVMLLDTVTSVFIWVGPQANETERAEVSSDFTRAFPACSGIRAFWLFKSMTTLNSEGFSIDVHVALELVESPRPLSNGAAPRMQPKLFLSFA